MSRTLPIVGRSPERSSSGSHASDRPTVLGDDDRDPQLLDLVQDSQAFGLYEPAGHHGAFVRSGCVIHLTNDYSQWSETHSSRVECMGPRAARATRAPAETPRRRRGNRWSGPAPSPRHANRGHRPCLPRDLDRLVRRRLRPDRHRALPAPSPGPQLSPGAQACPRPAARAAVVLRPGPVPDPAAGRDRRRDGALARGGVADAEAFRAITTDLVIPPDDPVADDAKLAVYRSWKVLNAIALDPDGDRFRVRLPGSAGRGRRRWHPDDRHDLRLG